MIVVRCVQVWGESMIDCVYALVEMVSEVEPDV